MVSPARFFEIKINKMDKTNYLIPLDTELQLSVLSPKEIGLSLNGKSESITNLISSAMKEHEGFKEIVFAAVDKLISFDKENGNIYDDNYVAEFPYLRLPH